MIKELKKEKPIIKGFVIFSLYVIGSIIIFTPLIVMEKLIVTKFQLALGIYLTIRTLEMLYIIAIFIFGIYGGYSLVKKISENGRYKT